MTFTNITKHESRCDTCKATVTNTWRAKQGHVCLTSPQNNTKT